jgi:ammonium transporter Rh
MAILEVILIALIWIFVRDEVNAPTDALASQRYPAFQDVNVMMLIGFGFLMTFIRSYAWSAISYTFLINAFITQYYILLSNFWVKVFHGGWSGSSVTITMDIVTLITCSYAVASVLITFGGVIGRVGPKDLLIIGTIHIIGYTLNEQIVFSEIGMIDAGGSSVIHTYGAYYGLTVCLILSRKTKPITNVKISYISNIFAFIGTLFLWLYWPSFNYALVAQNDFEQNLIVVNTVLSLTGSCIGTFVASALGFGRGLEMENILNATLAGGVVIGAPASIIYRPGLAIFIGFTTGIISAQAFHNLTPKLLDCIGLYDTCGIHNLHGIPGLLGGIWSAVIIAFYDTGYDLNIASMYSNGHFGFPATNSFHKQGGLQIAGTFCSLGMGIAFGILGGLISRCFYEEKNKYFYLDT